MSLSDVALAEALKKQGRSDEEIKSILEFMQKHPDEVNAGLGVITGMASAAANAPPQIQNAIGQIMPVMLAMGMNRGNDLDQDLAKVAAIRSLFGGDEIKELKEQIEKLMTEKQKSEIMDAIDERMKELQAKIDSIQMLQQVQKAEGAGEGEGAGAGGEEKGGPANELQRLLKQLKETEEAKSQLMEMLGVKPQQPSDEIDYEKAKEVIVKHGGVVDDPKSPEFFQQELKKRDEEWNNKMKQALEDVKKQTIEEERRKAERDKMLMDFAANVFSAVLENLGEGEKAGIGTIVKRGLGVLRGQLAAGTTAAAPAGAAAGAAAEAAAAAAGVQVPPEG